MSDDEESIGSLKDFIVADEEASSCSESEEPVAKKAKVVDETETVNQLVSEAKAFASDIKGTTVNGRTLRSRDPSAMEKRKPKDEYYERFGRDAEAKLLEKFTKKDIIEFVKDLEKDNRSAYEDSGHTWPKLNVRMSLEDIQEEYQKIKDFLSLPDSDGEESVDSEDESDSEVEEQTTEEDTDAEEDSDAEDSEADAEEDSDDEDDSDSDDDDDDGKTENAS